MGKFSLLVGAGIGYVLGTRSGRQQYDSMVAGAQRLWQDPRVQKTARQARGTASDLGQKAGDTVAAKVDEHTGSSTGSGANGVSTTSGPTTTGGTTTGVTPPP